MGYEPPAPHCEHALLHDFMFSVSPAVIQGVWPCLALWQQLLGRRSLAKVPSHKWGLRQVNTCHTTHVCNTLISCAKKSVAAGIPLGQVSIFLVAFIAFFFFAAIFTGNIGETRLLFMQ